HVLGDGGRDDDGAVDRARRQPVVDDVQRAFVLVLVLDGAADRHDQVDPAAGRDPPDRHAQAHLIRAVEEVDEQRDARAAASDDHGAAGGRLLPRGTTSGAPFAGSFPRAVARRPALKIGGAVRAPPTAGAGERAPLPRATPRDRLRSMARPPRLTARGARWLLVATSLAALAFSVYAYSRSPEIVPVHYGSSG